MQTLNEKYEALKAYLRSLGSVAVAFSGGVDSALLLYAAKDALGDRMIAVTAAAGSFPEREYSEAVDFCGKYGVRQITCSIDQMSIPGFSANPKNRCYICKKAIFTGICEIAREQGMAEVAEGSNLDDTGDYRPGMLAIAELGIKSPLKECGLTKQDIRDISKMFGLPTWNKQSFACLASRFPYGETITPEKLLMIDRAEQMLLDKGFRQLRVRIHGTVARIELLPQDMPVLMQDNIRTEVYEKLRSWGFSYVTLDLLGYRTGSMNETLTSNDKT